MTWLIVKKEIMENWTNITEARPYTRKGIRFRITKWIWEHKTYKYEGEKRHYKVEVCEYDI